MGRGTEILQLLAGEDIQSNQMDLGVTVLASLGGRHFGNLAGTILDHNMTILAQGRALHRVGSRGAGIDAIESVFMLFIFKFHELAGFLPQRHQHSQVRCAYLMDEDPVKENDGNENTTIVASLISK